jgi:hypothetical protein
MGERMNIQLKMVIIRRYGSNVAFSIAMGVAETLISRVIHQRVTLSLEEQNRWASALGCSPRIFDTEYAPRWMGKECAV